MNYTNKHHHRKSKKTPRENEDQSESLQKQTNSRVDKQTVSARKQTGNNQLTGHQQAGSDLQNSPDTSQSSVSQERSDAAKDTNEPTGGTGHNSDDAGSNLHFADGTLQTPEEHEQDSQTDQSAVDKTEPTRI